MTPSIYVNDKLLWHPAFTPNAVTRAEFNRAKNLADSLTFSLPPDHPGYDMIDSTSTIKLYHDDILMFTGRLLSTNIVFNNVKTIVAESHLAALNDSIVRPYTYTGDIRGWLSQLITNHNSTSPIQISIGTTDEYDLTASSHNYPTTMEHLFDTLPTPESFIICLYDGGNPTLHFRTQSRWFTNQTLAITSNILDLTQVQDLSETYTSILPLGATIDPEFDDEGVMLTPARERVTIASVNDGQDFIDRPGLGGQTLMSRYGRRIRTIIYNEIDTPIALMVAALNHSITLQPTETAIEVTAIDISDSSLDISQINPLSSVTVVLPHPTPIESLGFLNNVLVDANQNGVQGTALIIKSHIDYLQPHNNTVVLGVDETSLTSISAGNQSELGNIIRTAQDNRGVVRLNSAIMQLRTLIYQSSSEIRLEVEQVMIDMYQSIQQSNQTIFQQTSDAFNFLFQSISTNVDNALEAVGAEAEFRNRFIRFVDGRIEIGEVGSLNQLHLTNDRLSFMVGVNEVAFLSDNLLTIRDGNFVNSLQIGQFAWLPQANGNLSFGFRGFISGN